MYYTTGGNCVLNFRDKDLPFHYYTSTKDRYYEGERPPFFVPPDTDHNVMPRVPRREQPAIFISGTATLPTRGTQSTRLVYHNKPIDLPPLPNDPINVIEHTY